MLLHQSSDQGYKLVSSYKFGNYLRPEVLEFESQYASIFSSWFGCLADLPLTDSSFSGVDTCLEAYKQGVCSDAGGQNEVNIIGIITSDIKYLRVINNICHI